MVMGIGMVIRAIRRTNQARAALVKVKGRLFEKICQIVIAKNKSHPQIAICNKTRYLVIPPSNNDHLDVFANIIIEHLTPI